MQLPWARCSTGLCLGPRTHRIGVEIRAVKPPNAVSGDAAFSSAASRATACTAAVTRRHAAASIILPAMIAVTQPAQANEPEPGAPDSSGAAARTAGVDSGSEDPFAPKGGQGLPDVPLVLLQPAQPSPRNRKRVSRGRWPAGTASCNVSQIIKGCWQLGGAHRGDPRTDRTTGRAALTDFETFTAAGISTFEAADVWGSSEAMIGQFLRLSPWLRDNVQLVTHITLLGNDLDRLSYDYLQYRLKTSLARMGVSSADLVLLQWEEEVGAVGAKGAGLVDAAMWVSELQAAGLTKAVGVANLDVPTTLQVLDAGMPLAAAQVGLSLIDRRPCLYLSQLAQQRGFSLLASGTLAGGWLSNKWLGRPASKARLDTLSKAKYGAVLKEAGGWAWLQDTLQAADRVAARHQVPLSAVALRWALQQPGVAAASVGARNARHVPATQAAFSFALDEEDMLELDAAYEGCPNPPTSDVFNWERGGAW